jgi:hypothetical protein
MPVNLAGYYSFYVPTTFPGSGATCTWTLSGTVAAAPAEMQIVRHDPLPSNITYAMEAVRTNAARAVLSNFSGPFNSEGGAAAYEMPSTDAWYEFTHPNAAPTTSVLTNVIKQPEATLINNLDGCSIAAHPQINVDPVDTQAISTVTGVATTIDAQSATYPSSALCGGTIIVIRTALSLPNARDGFWQLYFAVESESSSQLFMCRTPDYSPLVVLEAQARFRSFRTITGNPDHFSKGLAKLRSIAKTGERVGNALVSTGVGGAFGGQLMGASRVVGRALNF